MLVKQIFESHAEGKKFRQGPRHFHDRLPQPPHQKISGHPGVRRELVDPRRQSRRSRNILLGRDTRMQGGSRGGRQDHGHTPNGAKLAARLRQAQEHPLRGAHRPQTNPQRTEGFGVDSREVHEFGVNLGDPQIVEGGKHLRVAQVPGGRREDLPALHAQRNPHS